MKRQLFDPRVSRKKMDPLFLQVMTLPGYVAARRLLEETFEKMVDVDGNFGKDFATAGFSPRLFELALFAYLDEFDLLPAAGRPHAYPDFIAGTDRKVAVEVTTSNPTDAAARAGTESSLMDFASIDPLEARQRMVFQFGNAIRKKLKWQNAAELHYWELPHTQGMPFVIAYGAFHAAPHSLMLSGGVLSEYLYGRTDRVDYVQGRLVLTPEPIVEHSYEGKRPIPSGLFASEEAANLAGVLFSNEHTATKFLRIGLERGYDNGGVTVQRSGTAYDLDPDASDPLPFSYRVGTRPVSDLETFAEGLHLFVNPWCPLPIEPGTFPGVVVHEMLEDGRLLSTYPPGTALHPAASMTMITQESP